MKKRILLLAFFYTWMHVSWGQVNFVFMGEIYGRTIDGLGHFQVQNQTGKPVTGHVMITVRENLSKLLVVTVHTQQFTVAPGIGNFPSSSYINGNFAFQGNPYGSLVNQTKNFPPGEYTYCFEFISIDPHAEGYDNCVDATITPVTPINLIIPADRDVICQKRPTLSWQPPLPLSANMRYRIVLTEKKGGASIENLVENSPLLLLDKIPSTMINYPSYLPDLKEGSDYSWQVTAFEQGVIISTSDIWDFKVQCNDTTPVTPNDSYRELKSMVNGNYYIANRIMKFSFTNNYSVKELKYALYETENGSKKIPNTTALTITRGLNKIDLDLSELNLVAGRHYILKIFPFNAPEMEVRFTYLEEGPTE